MSRRRVAIVLLCLVAGGGVVVAVAWILVGRFHGLAPRTRHAHAVTSVAFTGDGSRLLSVSREEEKYLLWEPANPLDRRFGARVSGRALRAVLAPGGGVLVVERERATKLVLVDLATGAEAPSEVWTRDETLSLMGFTFSPDGKCFGFIWEYLGVGRSPPGGIGTCNTPTLEQHWGFCPQTVPLSLDFTPDSKTLVAGGEHELTLTRDNWWSTFTDPVAPFRHVKCSPDGLTVYGGGERSLVAWDVEKRVVRWTAPATVDHLEATADGRFVVALGAGVLRVFDAASGKPVGGPPGSKGDATAVALSPRGERVAIGHADGSVEIEEQDVFLARFR
jgi:WD40 repeat protein